MLSLSGKLTESSCIYDIATLVCSPIFGLSSVLGACWQEVHLEPGLPGTASTYGRRTFVQ
jgi:hypothetical protein